MRTASARVQAPTNAAARPRWGGVSAAAAAKNSASTSIRTSAPYQLKARAQKSPSRSTPARQPAGPQARAQGEPAQAPVEQRRAESGRGATTPTAAATAPGGRRPRPRGRPRCPGAAGGSQERVCRGAAARDAGGDPHAVIGRAATATPPRRATADSTPAVRRRWCTRYWGKAPGHRTTTASIGGPVTPRSAPSSSQAASTASASLHPSERGRRSGPARRAGAPRRRGPGAATCGRGRCRPSRPRRRGPCAGCAAGTRKPVPCSVEGTSPSAARKVTSVTEA